MARTVRDASLETRTARARLQASGKPYYRAIDPGLHLGYRKGKAGGKWVMRWYVGDGDYQLETLATADDSADADGVAVLDFRQAQAVVRARHLEYARVVQGLVWGFRCQVARADLLIPFSGPRGACHWERSLAPRPCIRLDPCEVRTMKQSFASRARLRAGGPILPTAL